MLLYVKEILEIIALIKPSQLNDNSVKEAMETPITTGARDNHNAKGICWPRMNCEAAALKKGFKACG
ncbi:hypothetical protein MA16_Dca026741 [Dendrobium catenatum]|uniref:Uncharacterized protein n=1 Tax=Dendrobium catenatum TaxID=906689 RepID=A0A2I0W2Q8_9ASPA|nr:hypothetical protein MA16_Dca026741 [Dendrobium catenatum]